MNEILLILQIIIIFSLVVLSKKFFGKEGLFLWIGLSSVLANIEVAKMVDVFGISATLGNVLFASNFLATDILSESYGKEDAKKGVYIGTFSIIIYLICTQIMLMFTPNEFDVVNDYMINLFNFAPRICFSSLLMYFIANRLDVFLYDKLLNKFNRKKIWLRNNICTIICNCLENFGFNFLAFFNILSIKEIIIISIGTCIIEIIVALCDTPFLYLAIKEKKIRVKV